MECCICEKQIEIKGTWTQGHNAQPVKDGRCCDNCNTSRVVIERINWIMIENR